MVTNNQVRPIITTGSIKHEHTGVLVIIIHYSDIGHSALLLLI